MMVLFVFALFLSTGCSRRAKPTVQAALQEEVLSNSDVLRGMVRFADVVDNYRKWKNKDFTVRVRFGGHLPLKMFASPADKLSGVLPFCGRFVDTKLDFLVDGLTLADAPEDLTTGDELVLEIQVDGNGKFLVKKMARR
jgi:hypothetical protein